MDNGAMDEQKKAALAQIKAVYEDGAAEINGREYKFHVTTHITRRKIFAFFTSIQNGIAASDFSFLASPKFAEVEKDINKMVTFDGNLLSKLDNHWDEYPEDYINFITCAMGVISYPFLKGSLTA